MLLSHSFLSHNCSNYHQTTKTSQSWHNNWKYRKFFKNLRPSSSPCRENGSKHSTILSTKLYTHQTKQPEPVQEATILTDVTPFEQDLKNSQLIIILYGFYVETSWHHSNNLRCLTKTSPPPSSTKPSTKPPPMPSPMPSPKSTPLISMNFHENSINLKWRLNHSLKIKTVKVKMSSAWFSSYNPRKSF